MKWIFCGPNGVRAGWRLTLFLLIFCALAVALVMLVILAAALSTHEPARVILRPAMRHGPLTPGMVLLFDAPVLAAALAAARIMARIEHRPMGAYGLPLGRPWSTALGEGAAVGFAALTLVMIAIYACSGVRVNGLREAGPMLAVDALAWGCAFIVIALNEEFLFRGYAQFTLTTGTRFWFAAVLTSVVFAVMHWQNAGETATGIGQVVGFALVLCYVLWRSGNLWFGVGLHAAWDWGQTYFYGAPDSGLVTSHALLATTFSGPAWVSGATAGPEGSIFTTVALVAVAGYASVRFRDRTRPAPDGRSVPQLPFRST